VDESDNQGAWGLTIFFPLRHFLKVPKRENFEVAFFTLFTPFWLGDLQTDPKNRLFYHFAPDFDGFSTKLCNWACSKKKIGDSVAKIEVVVGCFWTHMLVKISFFNRF
jgi:hypothetical protein